MTFKKFETWYEQRNCDGHLGALENIGCSCIIEIVHKKWFWKREKFWKRKYATDVMELVVNPIEKKITKLVNSADDNV